MSLLARLTRPIVTKPNLLRSTTTKPKCLTAHETINKRFYTVAAPSHHHALTWKSAVVFGMTAVGLVVYFKNEKEKYVLLREKRDRDKMRRLGKPNIGEPFELFNVNQGQVMKSQDVMQGHFTLVYFGFTHCPDICPEELDKMGQVVDNVKKELGDGILIPVFITCDPLRDTEQVVKEYVQDFHPDLIGFTGSAQELKQVAKSFRVYSYTPPDVSKDDDYLVDHSIFFYLMDPDGKFVDCYARDTTADEVLISFKNYLQDYLLDGGKMCNYELKK